MDPTFHTRFTLTLDDFRVLNEAFKRLTPARRFGRYVCVFVALLMIAGAGFSFWVLNDWPLGIYFVVLAILLMVLQFIVAPWQQRRSFEHQRLGEFEIEMKADEDGFWSRSELAEGRQKWASIRQIDNLPGHVILWPNNRIGWIMPKRAFATDTEADAFAEFAKEMTAGQKL